MLQLETAQEDLSLNIIIKKEISPYLEKIYWICKEWDETIEVFVARKIKELSLTELAQYQIAEIQNTLQNDIDTKQSVSITTQANLLEELETLKNL